MKEQLSKRAPILTRMLKMGEGLGAITLGDVQGPARTEPKFTKSLCKGEHRWVLRRHTKRCRRCGLEDAR